MATAMPLMETTSMNIKKTPPTKTTKRRALIAAAVEENSEFVTAQQIHAQLRSAGESVGLATVYRALQAMEEAGQLDSIRTGEGESAYRVCSSGHHHHLICRQCGKTVEIFPEGLEDWVANIAAENGFSDPDHLVEVWGLCSQCS